MAFAQTAYLRPGAPEPIEHGGDLGAARRRHPQAPEPWIDLSTGINPYAYPFTPPPAEAFRRLPEPGAQTDLEKAAAHAYGLDAPGAALAAPGAQALIQALPQALAGRRVGVLVPTYAEHAAAWTRAGREVVACASVEALAACDIGVLVNPNNPDGRVVAVDALAWLARRTRLVVDESFVDFTPDSSFASEAPAAGAVVLRSFGKTYGLAGVRLGFAVGPSEILARLRAALGPWAVSGAALAIGAEALADAAWREAMGHRLAREAARLDAALAAAGFAIVGGTRLFRLAAHERAAAFAQALGARGVHVRRFAERPDWLRFGLPPDEGWERLETALRAGPAP